MSRVGKRGWDDRDPAVALRWLRDRGFKVGHKHPGDTGDIGTCVYCGFHAPFRFGERLIRVQYGELYIAECVWCVRRLQIQPPWPEKYEIPR